MKRRNVDTGKMRRVIKRNKISEGFYESALLYLKFLVLWILVILADFILEFRFEFLWPFYLLLRSVYDSFKYQGLAFSVFFVCIALTSDMLCFFLVPVHWLFFAASTYVWVQYVWYTDRGICIPTITLWMLFVYLEAAVRLKDVKHLPGRIDFCRPFAAHCLGYPAVTLGFGFKSYVGFRMRQKTQRNVAKENEFYLQLMQQALPPGSGNSQNSQESSNTVVVSTQSDTVHSKQCNDKNGHLPNDTITNGTFNSNTQKSHRKLSEKLKDDHDYKQIEKCIDRQKINILHPNGVAIGASINETPWIDTEIRSTKRKEKREQDRDKEIFEYLERLEMDSKRLRADLQTSRASEQELRLQITALTSNEKVFKSEQLNLQHTVEELQNKLQSVLSSRTVDRQTITNLERKITEERRYRLGYEAQIGQDRTKNRKEDTKIPVTDYTSRGDCTESCKARKRDLESELQECRTSQCWSEERITELERDNSLLLDKVRDTDLLKCALESIQEKNINLENNLSAETRIKLDLFSALGEAKRQLEIKDMRNKIQEKEIDELKTKIAQVLAVMPNDSFESPTPLNGKSRVKLTENLSESTLDPNAMAYTPKTNLVNSIVTSTEA